MSGKSTAPSPSRIYLPRLVNPPSTIADFLCFQFPQLPREAWLLRIMEGKVLTEDQKPVTADTPYHAGISILYFRETTKEAVVPFLETVIFQNEYLLVADKPHFLPVTPAGHAVNECLLYRLQRKTGNSGLAPLHRLDRDTAGLVLFSKEKQTRPLYSRLFAEQSVIKKYVAVAALADENAPIQGKEWLLETRIEREPSGFSMRISDGPANARTRIILREVRSALGYFELQPDTGKKHQLRLHLMSLGFSILNDPFYPVVAPRPVGDFSRPLQLLASGLNFSDPVSGEYLEFSSQQKLAAWE